MRAAIIQLTIAVNAEEDIELKDVLQMFKEFCGDGQVAHELETGGEIYLDLSKAEGIGTD